MLFYIVLAVAGAVVILASTIAVASLVPRRKEKQSGIFDQWDTEARWDEVGRMGTLQPHERWDEVGR